MRTVAAALFLLGFAVLGLAGAVIWYGMAWRMGWFQGPPQMAQGMWGVTGAVSQPWTQRLRQSFPIGDSERHLLAELRRQGFEVDRENNYAGYGWAAYPCVYTLTVRWRTDGSGRVRDVQGGLQDACTDKDRLIPERPQRRRQETSPRPAMAPPLVQRGQSA
jgi:hypothetical protein